MQSYASRVRLQSGGLILLTGIYAMVWDIYTEVHQNMIGN